MEGTEKKPLLVGLIEREHSFVTEEAAKQGISKTAYIRNLINREMKKK